MKLKLTYHRDGERQGVDLVVTTEPATTVGAIAAQLATTDPEGGPPTPHATGYTLAVIGSPGVAPVPLDPEQPLAESGIVSGSVVRLEPVRSPATAADARRDAAAVVRVVAGPDAGKEFTVGIGSSVIGRAQGCEVRLGDPLVSRQHARLNVTDTIEVVDLGSSNGLGIGDELVDRVLLRPGEEVRIGDSVLTVHRLRPAPGTAPTARLFNRPPVLTPRYEGKEMVAPEPPDPPSQQRFPILPLFAPLILGLVLYLSTKSLTSLVFVGMSPLLIVANAVESRTSGLRTYREREQLFRDDVADLVTTATAAASEEAEARRRESPSPDDCTAAAGALAPLLWSRRPDLPGFGEVRLGLGRRPARNHIKLPSGKRNNRALWHELDAAVAPFATVDDVPVLADLGAGALGVAGPVADRLGIARGIVAQVVCLHSPAELVVVAMTSSQSAAGWEWLKWLPHCLSPQSPLESAPLVSSGPGCATLLGELEREVALRSDTATRDGRELEDEPDVAVLVLVEDDAPADRSRLVALARSGPPVGIYLLWAANDTTELPAACTVYVEAGSADTPARAGFVHEAELVSPVRLEPLPATTVEQLARQLAPVLDASAPGDEQGALPSSVPLLSIVGHELAEVPDAVLERWRESRSLTDPAVERPGTLRPPATLRAVIGLSALGVHVLDLRTHGPHALVGGTTGSGKSELLQTWIVGMALSNSPERVTFLLVDYKGGSAFSDCVQLPHTVGLVTDLSQHLVRRALTSLAAELRHREQILHRKGAKDLATLEQRGDPDAPPSLVIVVDEFAALVQEVPEFVDGVVNVAQRGRSLGLHLILATQRPAGVIKDNLRANTNLRLALRMADEADSTDVLGSAEAASFDPSIPGRAVSKTGPTQRVAFQAAYIGGWTSRTPPPPDIGIETFGFGPRREWRPEAAVGRAVDSSGPNDIKRLVDNVRAAHDRAGVRAPRRPWLDELAPVYDLAVLPSPRRDDQLVFGVVDLPARQEQPTVAFYPDRDGNLAVYGTGHSGKSVLLRTLAVAAGLTKRGGPCHVYGLDFGSRGLHMLEDLPHVGSIVPGSDVERIGRLLGLLRATIDERAERFARVGAGSIGEYRLLAGKPDEARMLLLVDGMGAFRTAFEGTEHNRLFETFLGIAADGRGTGVHVVVSADRSGAVPSALASHLQRRVVLRLADANDYALMGVPSDVVGPKSPPGRGLLGEDEVQVAVLGGSSDVAVQARAMNDLAASMTRAGTTAVPPIRRLPDVVSLQELPVAIDGRPTIGLAGNTLAPIGVAPAGAFLVTGAPASGRTTAVACLLTSLRRWRPDTRFFYFGNLRSSLPAQVSFERAATTPEEAAALASWIQSSLPATGAEAPYVVAIESLADFLNGPADSALVSMARALVSAGHLVIGEGESSSVVSSFPLLSVLRNERSGLVLQPDQTDGAILRVQFPRTRRADFPPGRGFLVQRGAGPSLVQIALPFAKPTANQDSDISVGTLDGRAPLR